MTAWQETNVRVPECAAAALQVVGRRRSLSRDETIRQVLDEYLTVQLTRDPKDRWTHISTVLRYPAAPWGRHQPRPGQLLRLRLAPGTADRLRAAALLLPGQARRAPREYQARSLTDAVVTAIALQEAFSDEFLEGLLPLLRQRSAVGLWRMAAAVTTTDAELAIHRAAEEIRTSLTGPDVALSPQEDRLRRVDAALETEVAWHASARFVVAANLARDHLSGPDAPAYETVLYAQDEQWREDLWDLRELLDRSRYLQGVEHRFDPSGRGAGAAWRAHRRVARQDFLQWLMARTDPCAPTEYCVDPPGWWVTSPTNWCAWTLPADTALSEEVSAWRAARRVLVLPCGDQQLLWPVAPEAAPPGWAPVPGIEPMITAAAELAPTQLVDFVEAILLDRARTAEDDVSAALAPSVAVPADLAVAFGFIDDATRHDVMAQARAATLRRMTDIIESLPDEHRHHRTVLESARGNARLFTRVATRLEIPFSTVKATWAWRVQSVADAIEDDLPAAVITWLAAYVHRDTQRALQSVTMTVWGAAF